MIKEKDSAIPMIGPLLTIAIPTFNRAEILFVSLSKLLPQICNFKDEIEIVISDNASEDHTQEVIKKFINEYKGLKIISNLQPYNTGYYGNFRKCREMSTGKYFWLLSDNEHLAEDVIRFLVENIKTQEAVGVYYFNNESNHKETSALFAASKTNFNSLIYNETAYKLTLISSVVILNDKSNDLEILTKFNNNSFLGFLFLCNALSKNEKILKVSGEAMESVRCNVYFDIFKSWTKDMMACVDYMAGKTIITENSKILFVEGYLKHVVRSHVYLYLAKGKLHGKSYGPSYDLKKLLDSYYLEYLYYKQNIAPLFNYPRTLLAIHNLLRRIFNKAKRTMTFE